LSLSGLLAVFESSPLAQLLIVPDDPVFTIAAASDAYLRLSGLTREELLGRGIFEVFPENPLNSAADGQRSLRAALEQVVSRRTSHQMPILRYDIEPPKDKAVGFEERYWNVLDAPVLAPDGNVEYILHTVREVTEQVMEERNVTDRKRAEERLQQQWHLFDTALSHTPDHTYIFDLEARCIYANRALLSRWQKPLDEVVGKNFFELNYPADLAGRFHWQIQQVIETKQTLRDQATFPVATGELRHFEYIFVPVLGADGAVEAVAGSTRDITERQRMEKALAASEQQLQRIFAQAPVAIVVFRGRDFVVEMANPNYLALLQGREVVGRPLADVVPELARDVWDVFYRVIDEGEPFAANEWHIPYDANKDGVIEDHWFNVSYNPLRDFDGSVSGMIAVLTDVTPQVLARQELERVNRDLEEFSFVVSHDLQEPLRMVNIYAHLMLKRFAGDDQTMNQYAAFVEHGVQRMETLLGDLLTYSRAVHSEELAVGSADLGASLAEALGVLSSRVAETGATINAGTLPLVRGDTKQMAHVFQNILSNALKYRKSDCPPAIHISAKQQGGDWVVSVEDNGIGFDPKYSERIFGLFKRLHREEYPGTGLGLAICQRIVARYGGRMWAEGKLGEGATFRFLLPGVKGNLSASHPSG
jgi:PAS domain S-box-containing protein